MQPENKNIIRYFLSAAGKFPGSAAISGKKDLRYGELLEKVKQRAAYLEKKKIGKGDRVLVFIPMSESLYVNVLALFYTGAVPVFIDEWVSRKRLELCCKTAQCKAFIAPFRFRMAAFFFRGIRKIPVWVSDKNNDMREHTDLCPCTEEDPALITFTTGSTGAPKAAIRTHGILDAQFNALTKKTGLKNGDVVMTTLPIVLLINLGCGATSVMALFKPDKPWRFDKEKIAGQVNRKKINVLIASPFFVLELCKTKQSLNTIKKIFTGGAPVFPSDAENIKSSFPESELVVVYGSTEAEPISSACAEEIINCKISLKKSGLMAGKTDPIADVKIISVFDEEMGDISEEKWLSLQKSNGRTGEIAVSGKHVVEKYFNNETAFRANKIVVNGKTWHRTGDAGTMDENGNLWLQGRCRQLFYRNEKMISPFIYEAILKSIPGISNGTVLNHNNKAILVLEKSGNLTETELKNKIQETGLEYDDIRFIKTIPKDPRHFSKIDYEKLEWMIR